MTEEYKKGKVPEIVREFDNTGNKYEINGIDQSKCKFFWRKENEKFQIINSGSYRITQEGGTYYLLIEDDKILTNATQFQICYFFEQQSSAYVDKFPELSVAVRKINDLVEDVKNIFSYLKSTGVTGDTSTMSKVLSELEEQCVWWLNNGRIESLPITEMYSKFDRLVERLRKEILKLLEQDLEVAERELLEEVKRQLDEYVGTDLKQRLDDYTTQLEERLQTMIDQAVADKGLMPEGSDWLEIGLGNWLVVDLFNKNYIHYPPQLNSSDNAGVVKKDITDGSKSQVIRFYTTTGKMLFIVRVNGVWSEWQELGEQADTMQFTQANHGFVFTAVTLDGATRKWVKANKYTSADGIAIKIDNDRFDVVTRGVVNIPTSARDEKGEPFVYDEYYFLSQEVDGGLSRTKNEIGTFQYLAHISEIDGKQVAYIDIGDSYDLDYEVVDTENADRVGIGTYKTTLRTADTIENLKRLKLKVGDVVEVLGYYTKGDGANHKRKIESEDDGSGILLNNGLWANRVVEDSKFASLKSTKKIFEKSDGYYYRIPNSILFKNKIFILADKRHESPSDLGYNNKISTSYRIYDLTTKVLSEEKFIFKHNVESNTGYSDALLYIVNEELYCMCLKYTGNIPLVYSNGDIIYKKTSDGINWSEEISIKTQLSSTDLIMPSPTNAIIYKENIIIPCNKEGYIKTIDGTTYEYVNLKTGSWENNITIYDDKLFMVGRNGLYTSANFIIDNDVAYPARNYGELSNGECLSSLKIYKGYWFHLVQNSNIRRRNNLVLRVFDDINELPIAQKTIYDITNTPLDKIENYDTGYSSLEIVEDVFYITYEFYGDIITEIHTLQELFGHSDFNRKIKKAYTDDTKLNEEGTLFIPQSYNSYSFYVGSHNKVVDKIIAGDNITIINDGKCAIEYNTYTKDNSVPNQILHLDKITVFAGESISLQRILNNKNWAVTNLSKNETIHQVTTPLKDVSILDLTKNSYRNLVVYKNYTGQTLEINEINNLKNGNTITFTNQSIDALTLSFAIENYKKNILLKQWSSCRIMKSQDKIWLLSLNNETQDTSSQLDTPAMQYAMELEGGTVKQDYLEYSLEKFKYDKQIQEEEKAKYEAYQQALTSNPNLTYEEFIISYPMMLPNIEEPTIPQSVQEFMKKYL